MTDMQVWLRQCQLTAAHLFHSTAPNGRQAQSSITLLLLLGWVLAPLVTLLPAAWHFLRGHSQACTITTTLPLPLCQWPCWPRKWRGLGGGGRGHSVAPPLHLCDGAL